MKRFVVMLGTDFSAPGGITAVLRTYRDAGLFERWPVKFLPTYKCNSTWNKLLTAGIAMARFIGWLLADSVAVVHAHSAARASFWRKAAFLMLGSLAGCRTILHLHNGGFPVYYREKCGPLRRWAIRAVLGHVDRVVVLTPGWLARIREIQPAARFEVIPNPVVMPAAPLVAAPDVPPAVLSGTVLFMGRLWQEKGIYDLIRATTELVKEFPELRVICAGDGDIVALRNLAIGLGLKQCLVFVGWVDGEVKDKLLAEASVFVLPSYVEGLPIGVLEAMANGIPVVATAVGGIPDALGNEAGLLVPPGNPVALAAALARLLRSPELRRRMGGAGRCRAEQLYACDKVLTRIDGLYRDLGIVQAHG